MSVEYIYPTSFSFIDLVDASDMDYGHFTRIDDPFDAIDDADEVVIDGASSTNNQRVLTVEFGAPRRFTSISSVSIFARLRFDPVTDPPNNVRFGPRIGGVHYSDTVVNDLTYETFEKVMATNPATGIAWTQADIEALNCDFYDERTEFGFDWLSACHAKITGVLAPVQLEQSRLVVSQMLRLRRRPIPMISIDLPILRADSEIGADITVSHRDIPWASSGQRGAKAWERAYLRVLKQAPDYLAMRTSVTALDLRYYLTTLWDTLRSDEEPSAQYQGVARLNQGGGRTFTRASKGWVPSPVAQARGIVRVIQLSDDTEKTLYDGTLVEAATTNALKRSSAVSGATGYTDSGASGTWTTTTNADPLFDSSVTANLIVGTAGSPHSADLVRQWPDTASIAGGTYIALQVDHKDDSGAALGWKLQRLVDNWYYNATTPAWQAGTVTNLMTVRTAWTQNSDQLGIFSVGASATALRLSLIIPSGGTASRVNRIAHAQITDTRWYPSRIVTDAAAVTTAADAISYENNTGKRSHVAAQGSNRVTVIPSFNSADLASGVTLVVWQVYHDASNYERLQYSSTSAAWEYVRRAAGSSTTASKAASVTAGTAVELVCRWTGTNAEWGNAAYTQSIFVNGVKGTDAVAAAAITETSPSTVYIGKDSSGNHFCGRIYELDFSPFVWSDDEAVDA